MAKEIKITLKNGTSHIIPATQRAETVRLLKDKIDSIIEVGAPLDRPSKAPAPKIVTEKPVNTASANPVTTAPKKAGRPGRR